MNSSKFGTDEEKKVKKEILKLGAEEIEGTLKKMTIKKKGLLLLLSFLLSFVVQSMYLTVDYDRIIDMNDATVATVGNLVNVDVVDGGYQPTTNNGFIYFDRDTLEGWNISEVLLKCSEPIGTEILLCFFYAAEGEEINVEQSVEYASKIEEEWLPFVIEKADYATFSLNILNKADVVFPFECIYLFEEPITYFDECKSKVTVVGTLLFTGILYGVFLLILTYPAFFKEYAGFIVVGLIYYCFLSNKLVFYDDVNMFMEQSSIYSFWEFARYRYFEWSSRQVIESVIYYLVYHRILWAILTTFLCVLTCFSMSRLLPKKSATLNWVSSCFFCMYPFYYMSESGWIATTTNYLWPLAFIMFTMVGVKRCLDGKTLKKGEIFLYCLAALYGGNQEQGAALLVGFLFVFFLYFSHKKISMKPLYPVCTVAVLEFIYHLVCPGNRVRSVIHTSFFPDFPNLSLWTKLEMGYTSTFYLLIMEYDTIFMMICVLVFFVAAAKQNMKAMGSIGITLAITILFSSLYTILWQQFPWILNVKNGLTETGTNPNFADPQSLIAITLITVAFTTLLLGLYLIFEDKMLGLLNVIILLAGVASRMIMSFSPTIWLSTYRTFIFMYFCFLVSGLFVYLELEKTEKKRYIQLAQGIIVLLAVTNMYFVLTDSYAYRVL